MTHRCFRIACVILIITGFSHLAGQWLLTPYFHLEHEQGWMPANETERQLLFLMNFYRRDVGNSRMSMMGLQDGFSYCYALFFLWLGMVSFYIAKHLPLPVLRRLALLQALGATLGTIIAVTYFFWLPAISFGAAAIVFAISFFAERIPGLLSRSAIPEPPPADSGR